ACGPASGATVPLGDTTVTCNAADAHGNHATPQAFKVTVRDTTGPAFSGIQPQLIIEANGPSGSKVNFPAISAIDLVDGPIAIVSCSPGTGSLFPLGTTTVSCRSTDGHRNTGTAGFPGGVTVLTPPPLAAPRPHPGHA